MKSEKELFKDYSCINHSVYYSRVITKLYIIHVAVEIDNYNRNSFSNFKVKKIKKKKGQLNSETGYPLELHCPKANTFSTKFVL